MASVFNGIEKLGPAGLVLQAILISLLGIFLLVGFIVLRRWYRARYFRRRNDRTVALRSQWDEIVSGKISAETWRFDALDCDIVESILLDRIVTGRFDAPERSLKNALVNCCRTYPQVLISYLEHADGPVRELLARVLGELASPDRGEELRVA